MALIVQKFGGSSLAGAERLERAAKRIADTYRQGNDVIAVLSARGNTTDELLREAQRIAQELPPRESDLLLSTGELISVSHMAILLRSMGLPAIALTGWQAGIHTDGTFRDARILHVDGTRIRRALAGRTIVLVAGFQGITESGEITTLGRGGSDTTAVALAAFLGADACHIYTDVDGVYTGDPRELPEARKLSSISFDDMLEMAAQGAKVLHDRSVELAKAHRLPFEVRSSFDDVPGTVVGPQDTRSFCGIAVQHGLRISSFPESVAKVSVIGAACDMPQTARKATAALPDIQILRIIPRSRCISVYVPDADSVRAAHILHRLFLP